MTRPRPAKAGALVAHVFKLDKYGRYIVELLNTDSGEFLNTALLCKNLATEYKGKS